MKTPLIRTDFGIIAASLLTNLFLFEANAEIKKADAENGTATNYDVAAYVWPAYQPEKRWEEFGLFKDGKGEWENVYRAKPKKPGHNQPYIPLWGYEPEDNPIVAARKIDACLAAGINVLIYDWYWYEGKPFLEGSLNAFLKAPNNERMKFALMWANHVIDDLWERTAPIKCKDKNGFQNIRSKPDVTSEEFRNVLVPRFIEFFKKPNYYKIGGKPLFQIFATNNLIKCFGSVEKVQEEFDYFEQKTKEAGFQGLELQVKCEDFKWPSDIRKLKFSGVFYYNWLELDPFSSSYWQDYSDKPDKDYKLWGETVYGNFAKLAKQYPQIQFYANVTCGWDTNPRFPQDVYVPVATGNTPERFEYFLRKAKAWADKNTRTGKPKLIFINALNEWTEGCVLEPDARNGYGFLNAVARVFGAHGQAYARQPQDGQ